MKKSRKIAGIIAATLFALTSGASLINSNNQPTATVKADSYGREYGEPDPDATELKVTYAPTVVIHKTGGIDTMAKWVHKVKLNHGEMSSLAVDQNFYKAKSDGSVNVNWPLDWTSLIGKTGKVVEFAYITDLQPGKKYTFLSMNNWNTSMLNWNPPKKPKIVWRTATADNQGALSTDPLDWDRSGPIVIGNFTTPGAIAKAKKSKQHKTYGYVTAAKNRKVRTYTSTGKFSKHYVYGHHTYRLSSKKKIKKRGTCYKRYGKNQWIQKKYLKISKR